MYLPSTQKKEDQRPTKNIALCRMRDSVLSDAADKHCIAYERTFRRINHRVQCLAIARVHAHISRGQNALGREERTRARLSGRNCSTPTRVCGAWRRVVRQQTRQQTKKNLPQQTKRRACTHARKRTREAAMRRTDNISTRARTHTINSCARTNTTQIRRRHCRAFPPSPPPNPPEPARGSPR